VFKNYLKTAIRILRKNKTQSIINIFGLAMGMAIFLLITMYCRNELSYNKFNKQHENIYQVEIGDQFYTAAPLGTMFKNNIPDFEKIVRIDYGMGGGHSPLIETEAGNKSKKMKVKDIVFADSALFDVFDFPVVYGDRVTALKEPYSIVLTCSTARYLFGAENVVGQTIHYIGDRSGQPRMDMTVTAVIEDVPNNSTISFNAVGSLSTFNTIGKQFGYNIDYDWRNLMYSTFVMFKNQDVSAFTNKANKLWFEQERVLGNTHEKISMIPLDDVYFHHNSKQQFIIFLQLIGIFILAIAIINFINLTIAKSSSRAKEIGMRKVVGANRAMLIKQFLGESIFISLLAMPFAVLIVELSKPYFFRMIDKQIPLDVLHQPLPILILVTGIVIIGFITGIYPAVILSSFKPTSILKGEITKDKKGNSLRYVFIVFQFAISISLIICTLLISKQVDYLKSKDLGFNNKNIIHFTQSQQIGQKYDVFKHELLKNPNVIHVSRSNSTLGKALPIGVGYTLHGLQKNYSATTADPDFIPTIGIHMVKGRPFSWDIQSDNGGAIIVNETFVKEFELKQPLGAEINFIGMKPRIIGVMKDFHYNSFHQKVEPAALVYVDWNMEINIRINNRNMAQTIQFVRDTWNKLSPETPFEFEFLDHTYSALYTSEEQFQSIINSFSIIAIFIACLGLFGLVSHSVERRIKEIGVRKILGASIDSIVFALIREYLKWVAFANIIAWPVAYYFMNKWLQDFAYRIDMSWWVFILSGGIALVIALATVSFHAIKAAVANPVESLRYE
jgi:putative ABC transport system permease protein